MNIKSLLLGSAAALAAVSGAQAADAIVAAEPEPMEYVRVCDAFGTGYFYIPGTETCLKIGGYVRFQVEADDTPRSIDGDGQNWNARTRALLNFETKSDTELGTLGSYIAVRTWADGDYDGGSLEIDEAYITLGGLKVGYMYNYWDSDLSGETDDIGSNRLNSIGYQYDGGTFTAGVFVDELTGLYSETNGSRWLNGSATDANYGQSDNVGIEGQISGALGPVTGYLLGAYDVAAEDGSVRAILSADLGPGTLSGAAIWSSGANAYYDLAEWTVAVQYAAKITDKLSLTPGFQYWSNIDYDGEGDFFGGDAYRAGLTLDYKIVDGLTSKVSVQYQDADDGLDQWSGFFRLQRTF